MVNKKFVAISYICTFLLVYLCAIAYAIIPPALNDIFNTNIKVPINAVMNETISAVSLVSGGDLSSMAILVVVLIIAFAYLSSSAMFRAYE